MTKFTRFCTILTLVTAIAAPANAFINPRAIATLLPDPGNPGYAMLRIEVLGLAWRCAGRVRMENGSVPEQTVGMECVGMAKAARATIRPTGQLTYRVNYKLNTGIKGHLDLI